MLKLPPISLYIHIPWCIKKCGYCDFYSYVSKEIIPETEYIKSLLKDLEKDLKLIYKRKINNIFIGGGTPSLLHNISIKNLITGIKKRTELSKFSEITIESNPKLIEYKNFRNYKKSGVNRFSLGVQTFNSNLLKKIERTYNKKEVITAIKEIKKINNNFNIDIMYGLPTQSLNNVLSDLKNAVKFNPTHISWYQLTIEPNTSFYKKDLHLPHENIIFEMFNQGEKFLKKSGYIKYEISSYVKSKYKCKHNLNYWNFGDYIGIGCGAHGKITKVNGDIIRTVKNKNINDFINGKYLNAKQLILDKDKPFEYFMNAFRLYKPIYKKHFQERTNISISNIENNIKQALKKKYLIENKDYWETTKKGKIFLNSLLKIFLN
ncbi:radical SAM family heme chaperone HemW [Buchnera aphidicola (Aphis craccivora)]|uniref:Heme chaperone HemW n=1 Tax=Buchnera aphidicola (Aphis craccivora) TaxID=466616 RepID=A0A4D6XK23_9GAMM|nr:radical SAM family heme chaperone HemW [Buchnera aphidicola]QCI16773.1 radical SAM family heme chaperone HemW [Buchnera aphidicola (Aphis craccivora)]QLL40905.1 radical SAM family heme chaperone HemW [Buchnera aphidicola (Aphis craccivore)]WAI17746.1 MAG: radical SAM family heme chaperone HemW [Buchnera aphidicola (Aphis craccivora)]